MCSSAACFVKCEAVREERGRACPGRVGSGHSRWFPRIRLRLRLSLRSSLYFPPSNRGAAALQSRIGAVN